MSKFSEYADDCIHLKACRRLTKIAKNQLRHFSRCCNENCSAYCKGEDMLYVTVDEAVEFARDGVPSVQSGYGAYDVYCSFDLSGKTIFEILNEDYKE